MPTKPLTPEERERLHRKKLEFWAIFDLLPFEEQERIIKQLEEFLEILDREKAEQDK